MNNLLERWIAALRSGEYKQTQGVLCDGNGGYCCLGVLEKVVEGEIERDDFGDYRALPSLTFWDRVGTSRFNIFNTGCAMVELSHLNDDGMPFTEIADMLEEGKRES